MNEVAAASAKVFGIMFQMRTDPVQRRIKNLVDSGELGKIKRTLWMRTDWYRSQSYYDAGGWRATWVGEGGGVLINQCSHDLDQLQWIFGMPRRIRAFCGFGKYHEIEAEDDCTAYLEYGDGATCTFISSTGESPGVNRIEVVGDNGKLLVENGHGHLGITTNWGEAILSGAPLLAPGEEGIKSLELSNAMLLSTWRDGWVDLPIDEKAFLEELRERAGKTV